MTSHRLTRVSWKTLQKRIREATRSKSARTVLWRRVVQTFLDETETKEAKNIAREEVELAFTHLENSGRAKRCVGATDDGTGLVVWLTDLGNDDSSKNPESESD